MKIRLYCQSIQKIVQNSQTAQGARRVTQYAVNFQTHPGDGVPVDSRVASGTFGATVELDERPEFDAGDIVEAEFRLAPAPEQAGETGQPEGTRQAKR